MIHRLRRRSSAPVIGTKHGRKVFQVHPRGQSGGPQGSGRRFGLGCRRFEGECEAIGNRWQPYGGWDRIERASVDRATSRRRNLLLPKRSKHGRTSNDGRLRAERRRGIEGRTSRFFRNLLRRVRGCLDDLAVRPFDGQAPPRRASIGWALASGAATTMVPRGCHDDAIDERSAPHALDARVSRVDAPSRG